MEIENTPAYLIDQMLELWQIEGEAARSATTLPPQFWQPS